MFLGQYDRTIDDKGRLAIPAELRSEMGSGAVLTRSFDTCLCIYPAAKWESLVHAIEDLPDVRTEVRTLARAFFGGAVPCELDRQGRLIVPPFLREFAGLNGEAIVVGVNSKIEIWAKEQWLQQQQLFESNGARLGALSLSGA